MKEDNAAAPGPLERALASRTFLLAVLLLAALLRLAHLVALERQPFFDDLVVDSSYYDEWAQRIAAGDWLGGPRPFYMDPLYPYLLGGVYRVFGHDLLIVRLLGVALGVGTCALVAGLGRWLGGPLVGNLSALLMAVYRPAIFHETEVEKTALAVFVLTLSLWLATRPSPIGRFSSGLTLGLAALTRGNALLLVPMFVLYFLFDADKESACGSARLKVPEGLLWRMSRRSVGGAVLFLAGFAMAVAPVTWRNHHVSGEWIPTTYGAGAVFYTGNNPSNATGFFEAVPFVRSNPRYEEGDFRTMAEARVGRPLRASEVSSYWFSQAIAHIRANPAFAFKVAVRKVGITFTDWEHPDGWDLYFVARHSPVLRIPLLGFAPLLGLAAVGAATGFRRSRPVRYLLCFVAVYALSLALFFVFSRYRMPLVVAVAVLAGAGLAWLGKKWQRRDRTALVAACVLAMLVTVLSYLPGGLHPPAAVHNYVYVADYYQVRGDFAAAEEALRESLRALPGNVSGLCNLGRLHVDMERYAEALPELSACLAADPTFPQARIALGRAFAATGRTERAEREFRRQLQLTPGDDEARLYLAEIELGTGRYLGAAEKLKDILTRVPDPRVWRALVIALQAAGRAADANAEIRLAAEAGEPLRPEEIERDRRRLMGTDMASAAE